MKCALSVSDTKSTHAELATCQIKLISAPISLFPYRIELLNNSQTNHTIFAHKVGQCPKRPLRPI